MSCEGNGQEDFSYGKSYYRVCSSGHVTYTICMMKSLIIDHKSVLCIVVHDYAWSACLVFYKRQMYQINVCLEIANMGKLIVMPLQEMY